MVRAKATSFGAWLVAAAEMRAGVSFEWNKGGRTKE